MIARGEIMGLFQLFADGDAMREARLEGVTGLASAHCRRHEPGARQYGAAREARNQALRDPLTGLYNRRYMEDCLQRFVRLADRENREVSVVMVDLDHFKQLNDEHGHAFGDAVLRDAAMAIVGALRETDIVCRYGGEELVVILPGLQSRTRRRQGRGAARPGRGAEPDARRADLGLVRRGVGAVHVERRGGSARRRRMAALYQAKQSGRNQVMAGAHAAVPARAARGCARAAGAIAGGRVAVRGRALW